VISDPTLPAAPHLFGEWARHLLAQGLGELGGRVGDVRLVQVAYRPHRELVARYATTVAWGGSAPVTETILAGTTVRGAPEGTVPLVADDLTVGMWRWPFDPALPGLGAAVTPSRAAALVGPLVGGVPALRVRAYRPTRRAVVHATGPAGEAYLKVLRPGRVADFVARHAALAGRIPVPEVLATDEELGIVALRALPGASLRSRLLAGDGRAADPDRLLALLDELATTPLPAGTRPATSPRATAFGHAGLLERVLPDASGRLAALTDRLEPAPEQGGTHVHGDLHDAQLTVVDSAIVGVLDLDGAGPGHRVDDLGNLLAHLSTMALGARRARPTLDATVSRLWTGFGTVVDPDQLARATAAAVVGLATGPFAAQQRSWKVATRRRLALAARWLRRADGAGAARPAADEGDLRVAS
jgi:aminoglycoside phosphotransferase (APT) family kinase protein